MTKLNLKDDDVKKLELLKTKLDIATLKLRCVVQLMCTHGWTCNWTAEYFGTMEEITQLVKDDKNLTKAVVDDSYHNYFYTFLLLGNNGKKYPELAEELEQIFHVHEVQQRKRTGNGQNKAIKDRNDTILMPL